MEDKGADHFEQHPFGQVPWLTDGDISIFESGAIVLYIGEKSAALLPTDPKGRSEVIKWVFAALNSVEMAAIPYFIFQISDDQLDTPGRKVLDAFLRGRLEHLDSYLRDRVWLTRSFSIADILMADVLRGIDRFGGLDDYPVCGAYVKRATGRPAFKKAFADQLAHYEAADKAHQLL
jgi:glutathione S-transferase